MKKLLFTILFSFLLAGCFFNQEVVLEDGIPVCDKNGVCKVKYILPGNDLLGSTDDTATNNKDSSIRGLATGDKNTNYEAGVLYVRSNTGSNDLMRSLLHFTLPSGSGTISDIDLFLKVETNTSYAANTVAVHRLTTTTWTETGVTWNCAQDDNYDGSCDASWTLIGGDFGTLVDSFAPTTATNWDDFVLIGAGATNPITATWGDEVHLIVKDVTESGGPRYLQYYSSEDATPANRPYIIITYSAGGANNAPFIQSVSDSPDPVTVGSDVTFSVNHYDPDGNSLKAYACKTDSFATSTGCGAGQWAASTTFSSVDPITFSTTTYSTDLGSNNYYVFVMDAAESSTSTSGSFTVEAPDLCTLPASGDFWIEGDCYITSDYYTEDIITINSGGSLTIEDNVNFSASKIIGIGTGKLIGQVGAQVKKKLIESQEVVVNDIPNSLTYSDTTFSSYGAQLSGATWDRERSYLFGVGGTYGSGMICAETIAGNGADTNVKCHDFGASITGLTDYEGIAWMCATGGANNEYKIAIIDEDGDAGGGDCGISQYSKIYICTIDDTTTNLSLTECPELQTEVPGECTGYTGGPEALAYSTPGTCDGVFFVGRQLEYGGAGMGDIYQVTQTGTTTTLFDAGDVMAGLGCNDISDLDYVPEYGYLYTLCAITGGWKVVRTETDGTLIDSVTINGTPTNAEGIAIEYILGGDKMYINSEDSEYYYYE